MSGAAEIRVANRAGRVFAADKATIEGPWVHASGRWRSKVGANHSESSYSEPMDFTWHASHIIELRWMAGA